MTKKSIRRTKLNFESHRLSEPDMQWLAEAYRSDPAAVSIRLMKARLYSTVGAKFDPAAIDRRFYCQSRIKLLGVWRVTEGNAPIFQWMSIFIEGVRRWLLEAPESPAIPIEPLRSLTRLTDGQIRAALRALRELHTHYNLGRFFSDVSDKVEGVQRVSFDGDDALDEYLAFTTVEALLERAYLSGQLDQSAWRLSRSLEKERRSSAAQGINTDDKPAQAALVLMAMGADDPESAATLLTIK